MSHECRKPSRHVRDEGNLVPNIPEIVDWESSESRPELGFHLLPKFIQKIGNALTTSKSCLCGCGQTASKRANYKPGHDASHASQIAQQIAVSPGESKKLLAALPSAALQAKAQRAAERLSTRNNTKPERKAA